MDGEARDADGGQLGAALSHRTSQLAAYYSAAARLTRERTARSKT